MSWMAIHLGQTSPFGSSDLPESRRAALCFLFGLASNGVYMCPACCQAGGSLLHCPSTLTGRRPAVYFCCTVPGVASARRYLASCPVKPGLSSPTAFRRCGSGHLSYLSDFILPSNEKGVNENPITPFAPSPSTPPAQLLSATLRLQNNKTHGRPCSFFHCLPGKPPPFHGGFLP